MSTHSQQLKDHETLPRREHEPTQSFVAADSPSVTSKAFDAIRFSLSHNLGSSVRASSSAADRKGSGIPTPPYSETTSSASGSASARRAQKDSSDNFPPHNPTAFQGHLQPPVAGHAASSSRRPASAASSSTNTGSDTIGATSPRQPDEARFRSHRHTPLTEATMATDAGAVSPRPSRLGLSHIDRITADSGASPSALRPSSSMSSHSHSPARKRRSEMHERDVSQIRSESRLGFGNADDDDEAPTTQQHPFPRASQHKYSPRKSTSLSVTSHRYDENEAVHSNDTPLSQRVSLNSIDAETPLTPTSAKSSRYTGGDEMPSGSMRRLVRTMGQASARTSLDDRTSPRPLSSAGRSPMPSEFRLPGKEIRRAYRAAHQRSTSDSEGSDTEAQTTSKTTASPREDFAEIRSPVSIRSDSLDEIREEAAAAKPASPRSPKHRRDRHAPETASDGTPSCLDYEGRLGTQGSRISVDSSSAQKYLARGSSQHSTPSSTARRTPHSSDIGSPSEDARARKISTTSSNRSQKSSSSASELHRAASRVSMRRQYGSDLFSTDTPPSASVASAGPYSPSVRTETSRSSTTSSDRSRPPLDPPRRVDDAGLDSLRSQIQDLRVAEHDRRRLPPMSLRTQAQLGSTRSSLDLNSPTLGSVRAQSVMGLQRTPNDALRALQNQHPATDPQRSRHDRSWSTADPVSSSDAVRRIQDLVRLRGGANTQSPAPPRSATALGTATDSFATSVSPGQRAGAAANADEPAPAPIRNLAVRLAQYEALYSKAPSADAGSAVASGPHTARTVELMSAIVRGTSTMWAELASMHPIATEGHLMGRQGDAFTEAFGQLDDGLAFVNKLVLEQARAMQDLFFLLDRTEKERQAQFNQALVELGRSPRSFSRTGMGANGSEAGSAERNAQLLRRAASTVRSGSSLQKDSPSPFARPLRGAGGSAERGATLTASQIRSMTSLGYNHNRSASEFSPSSAAAQRRIDRAAEPPRETSFDSPLSSRRSTISRVLPTGENVSAEASATDTIRPPPAFTPRRPRLSNPSVSNATASFQPGSAAPSVFASSPDSHDGVVSEGSTVGVGEVDEFGRVEGSGGETVRLSSRSQRMRNEQPARENATVRGGAPRVIDTLASQLDTLHNAGPVEQESTHRRHTINASLLSDALVDQGSPTKALKNTPPPPPRPPRNIQRPSEESLSSPERRPRARGDDPSTPTAGQNSDTPRQSRAAAAEEVGAGAGAMVRSLGRTAARRVSRVLGTGQ